MSLLTLIAALLMLADATASALLALTVLPPVLTDTATSTLLF